MLGLLQWSLILYDRSPCSQSLRLDFLFFLLLFAFLFLLLAPVFGGGRGSMAMSYLRSVLT
jgi:hypothetical protein